MNNNLKRFTESITLSKETMELLPFKEGTKTVLVEGSQRQCHAAYLIDVSRYDYLNQNKRNYPKKLWERVIQEQKPIWSGGVGLANHPSGEGSVKDIFCVWDDLTVQEGGKVKAKMFLVGKYGNLAKEVLEAGGRVEVSSSGFGELMQDGQTVNPDTFLIERVADWVLDASQRVWATQEDLINSKESMQLDNNSITNNNIEEKKVIIESNKELHDMNTVTKTSPEDKAIRRSIKNALREAKNIDDPRMRLKDLEEIAEFFEDVENKEVVKELQEEHSSLIKTSEKAIADLVEKGEKLDETATSLKEANEKITSLEEENKALKEKVEKAESVIEVAKEEMQKGKEAYQQLKDLYQNKTAESNVKVSAEDYLTLHEELEKVKGELEEAKKCKKTEEEDPAEKKDDEEEMKEEEGEDKKDDKEEKDSDKKEESTEPSEDPVEESMDKVEETKSKMESEDEKEEEEDSDDEKKDSEDKEDDSEDKPKEEKKESIENPLTSKLKFKDSITDTPFREKYSNRSAIKNYWADLKERYGDSIASFEKSFLGCNTIEEAQNMFFRVKPILQEDRVPSVERFVTDRKEETLQEMHEKKGIASVPSTIRCKPHDSWL